MSIPKVKDLEIEQLIKKIVKENRGYCYNPNDLKGKETYDDLIAKKSEEIKPLILRMVGLLAFTNNDDDKSQDIRKFIFLVVSGLIRRNQNYTDVEWMELFQTANDVAELKSKQKEYIHFSDFPFNYAIQQLERFLKKNEMSDTLKTFLINMLDWSFFASKTKYYWGADIGKAVSKLNKLLQVEGEVPVFKLTTQDIGPAINELVNGLEQKEFHQLFQLASEASGGKPTQKFQKEANSLLKLINKNDYRKIAQSVLTIALEKPIEQKVNHYNSNGREWSYEFYEYLDDLSKQFIKGIVWTMEEFSDKESIRLLGKMLGKGYEKMPGIGPAAAAIGNACAYTLGNMRGKDGLGELSRLKLKLKQNNIKKTIDKYLTAGAKKYNVSVEELKEMAIPDFKLENGTKTIPFDDYNLTISIVDRKVVQQWYKPDGNTIKSVPSIVKNDAKLKDRLKKVRAEVKDIQKVYSAQKLRMDNQFVLNRTWDYPSFEKYYINHGLVQLVAKRLIWTFEKGEQKVSAIQVDNQWQNEKGEAVDWIDKDCMVKLWHPVFSDEAGIIAWRERMMDLEWKQPLKQAFRELYILTDAEINTQNYSNRMASHILKQHQFKTLAVMRDWAYSLMGAYDDGIDGEICRKKLTEYNITAEYWIDELNDHEAFNDAGIWLYVSTDQVKFKDANDNVMNLVDVPKIVFSEIMRDVDLFVGVASVGNDPEWRDNNGERQTHRDYWTSYSFGDLSEIAKTRKSILERLLPRLTKIRDKSRIDGKFLIVEGKLRTYKIHIGSGNILMEPNDQYLCIVPARNAEKSSDKLFIPFEGDKGLSIVLSKAFLLAEDDKIKDSTITSQINRA